MQFRIHHYNQQVSKQLIGRLDLPEFADAKAFSDQIGRPLTAGDRYYDGTRQRIRTFNGTRWVDLSGESCSA